MDNNQKDIFIKAAQDGVACGLFHPIEWYVNATRMLSWGHYETINEKEDDLLDAFLSFWKNTAGCPEEQEWLDQLTPEQFIEQIVNPYYARNNEKTTTNENSCKTQQENCI